MNIELYYIELHRWRRFKNLKMTENYVLCCVYVYVYVNVT